AAASWQDALASPFAERRCGCRLLWWRQLWLTHTAPTAAQALSRASTCASAGLRSRPSLTPCSKQ
ncbi:unnamed protein product, partial [Closterium sp. Naga37s-1]